MSSIWVSHGESWCLLAPIGFPDEQALHELVEKSPELLPLAGSPRLIVVGREVSLGGGYADLLAVEPSGRLAIIEVKLAKNAEARRAVVAQVLAYAAFLKGTELATLEGEVLQANLRARSYETLASLVASEDQEGSFDAESFINGVKESLSGGRFRLVFVLDDVPAELVRLVGYLESIAPELVIDLVTVSAYEVNGSRVLVPQRVDPERSTPESQVVADADKRTSWISPDEFADSLNGTPPDQRERAARLLDWARQLEAARLARLIAVRGSGRCTLLPHLPDEAVGLVTVWSYGAVSFWRSVFERRAPNSIPAVEEAISPARIGQGNETREISDQLLEALTSAYREASS